MTDIRLASPIQADKVTAVFDSFDKLTTCTVAEAKAPYTILSSTPEVVAAMSKDIETAADGTVVYQLTKGKALVIWAGSRRAF